MKQTNIRSLMEFLGLSLDSAPESISLTCRMSGLEDDPKNDWLYVGLTALRGYARTNPNVRSAAFIGSGNGIDVIGSLRCYDLKKIVVTDLLPDILENVKENIERNTPKSTLPWNITYISGRDCEPIPEKVDLIYANLPLIMVDESDLDTPLSTTTLTDASFYRALSVGDEDLLLQWSLLSQLGFLQSAKKKLTDDGRIITLIGGRVPYSAIDECFKRAGLDYEQVACALMRQSDPQYLKQYADQEQNLHPEKFIFFDEERAVDILHRNGMKYPDIVSYPEERLREMLRTAQVDAWQAYKLFQDGKHVAHIAYAFTARHSIS